MNKQARNTRMTTPSTSRRWSDDELQTSDINFNTRIEIQPPTARPSLTIPQKDQNDSHFTMTRQDAEDAAQIFLKSYDSQFDEHALEAANAFYNSFKSACRGISRRDELDRLYNATYSSFASDVVDRPPPFNKVLFAMARSMHVVKVIKGGTLEWTVFDHRPRYDDRRDDCRPRYNDQRHDYRPRYDNRRDDHPEDRRDDYRPRYDYRPRFDNRRPHYNERDA